MTRPIIEDSASTQHAQVQSQNTPRGAPWKRSRNTTIGGVIQPADAARGPRETGFGHTVIQMAGAQAVIGADALRGGRISSDDGPDGGSAGERTCRLAAAHPFRLALKTGLDIIVSALALVLLLPLLLAIAFYVRADGGPILFVQTRVGRNGCRFRCLKFRTMQVDSDRALQELLQADPAAAQEWHESQKLSADPRVTEIGAFLRKTSLDELPQLLNVLRGDMSLVGPRPIVEAEIGRYGDSIASYYAARPGITGLWQVSGRSRLSYAQRVQLDVSYVRDWSLLGDLSILGRTVHAVLARDGAM